MLKSARYQITISKAYLDSVDALRKTVQAKELVGIEPRAFCNQHPVKWLKALHSHLHRQGPWFNSSQLRHYRLSGATATAGGAVPAGPTPAAGSMLAADYGSDEEEAGPASIQGSAATAAEQRDSGSQSAGGLPSNFFEVCFLGVCFEAFSHAVFEVCFFEG